MKQSTILPIFSAAIAVAMALAIFGIQIANPHDVSWIKDDAVTALFGWDEFRFDKSNYTSLSTGRYSYPIPMPIAMFDIIPFIAILVKFVSQNSTAPIQYFGPLFIIGIAAQTMIAWALLREATVAKFGGTYHFSLTVGALFFGTAPVLLDRFYMMHMSLSLQWPLILSLLIYVRSFRVNFWRSIGEFTLISFVAAAINPYIMVMTLVIYGGFIIKVIMQRPMNVKNFIFCLIPFESAFASLTIFGFLNSNSAVAGWDGGFGLYSANFLTLVNPMSKYLGSEFLPDLKLATEGQYEGYGYLGLGAILLITGSIIFGRIKKENGAGMFFPLCGVILVAYLLAMSHIMSFGAYSFEAPVPTALISFMQNFRSAGRFIWVVVYTLLFIGIAGLIRMVEPKRAATIMCLAALVQVADLARPAYAMHQRFSSISSPDRFADAAYLGLARGHDTLLVMPPWQCRHYGVDKDDYPVPMFIKFSHLAMDNQLRTNSFYAGRTPSVQANYHCVAFPAAFKNAPANKRTAYILSNRMFRQHGAHIAMTHYCDFAEDMFICRGDRNLIGLSPRAQQAVSNAPTP